MAELQGRRSFVGRGVELARLRAALDATMEGRAGRTIVIAGEAGIGKSRLVGRFREDLDPDVRVLEGACLEVAEDALPYAPFVEILRGLVRQTPPERLPAVLGPGRSELTRLLPELAIRAADIGSEPGIDRASQARLWELVLGVFERLSAEHPIVIAIDDVQWADRSTRDLVGFLCRALRDDPALLILTTRTDATGEAVGNLAFLAELEREDHVDRVDLQPFDRDEVAQQMEALLDGPLAPGVIDRVVARTDGNPFYVEELVMAGPPGATTLPPVLHDVLAARIGGVSGPVRDILRAAAAGGRRIDDELLASVLGLSPAQLGAGLREALASGILVRREAPDGAVVEFRHALLHEVVDRELLGVERAALHVAYAEGLEAQMAAGDRRVSAVEIARHWDGARQPERALPFMLRAAAAAEAVYAFAEALRLWERAAAILADLPAGTKVAGRDSGEVLIHASDCAMLIGEPRRAAELIQRALLLHWPGGDRERLLVLENRQRWHLWWSGERAATIAAIEAALAALPDDPPSVARARVLAQLAGVRMLSGDFEGSATCAREAIEIGERAAAADEVVLAYGVLGWDMAMLGDVDAGIVEFRRGQAIVEAIGSVEGMAIAATNLAALLDRVGRSEAALEAARAGYALTERYGVARTFGAILLGHAAKAELALGRWDEADRSTAMGLRRGAIDGGAVWLSVNRARLLVGRGRFDEAAILLQRARGTDQRLGGTDYRTALVAAEAELAAWTGRLEDLLTCADAGLALLMADGAPDPSLAWLAALVLRGIADAKEAIPSGRPVSEAGLALAARADVVTTHIKAALAAAAGNPGFAAGDRAQALIALLRGEMDRLERRSDPGRWRELGAQWAALGRPFQVAYARLREAEAILASGGAREAAVKALGAASEIAARLGAVPLGERIARLARQARIALPTPAPGVAAAGAAPAERSQHELTAREADVLRLVAAGWTNQQIADALFITRKTASVHVSNVMGKLGAANRGEAAALAHRLGLAADAPLPVGHH